MNKLLKLSLPVIISFASIITCTASIKTPQKAIENFFEISHPKNDPLMINYPAMREFSCLIFDNINYEIIDCTVNNNTATVTLNVTALNLDSISKLIKNEVSTTLLKNPIDSLINYCVDGELGLVEGILSAANETIISNIPAAPTTQQVLLQLIKDDGEWTVTNPQAISSLIYPNIS